MEFIPQRSLTKNILYDSKWISKGEPRKNFIMKVVRNLKSQVSLVRTPVSEFHFIIQLE